MKGKKFHLVDAARKHLGRRNSEPIEDNRQLVHERDVEIALRVLDHFRCFGDFDRGSAMNAGRNDGRVNRGDALERRVVLTCHDLGDRVEAMHVVAWIDALGRIAELEIDALPQSRRLGEKRSANFASQSRIDRRFEDHDGARAQRRSDEIAGADDRLKIRAALGIDRSRHGHDEEARLRKVLGTTGEPQIGRAQFCFRQLPRAVLAGSQLADTLLGDIEAVNRREFLCQGKGHGQSHIAEPDDRESPLAHARPLIC